jgi:DNA-binding transcriptional LysR family regulator
MSQPALSRSLTALESELHVPLFDRTGGAASATVHGQFLADRAEAILHAVESTERELRQWAMGGTGLLRIGVGPITRLKPMATLLPSLTARYPQLRIQIRQETGPNLVRGVASGLYDVAFSYSGNAAAYDTLVRSSIYNCPVASVVHRDHPLARSGPHSPDSLLRFPIATNGVAALRQWAGRLSASQERNLTALLCDDAAMVVAQSFQLPFVAHGPLFIFDEALRRGDLCKVEVERPYDYECWMLASEGMWQTSLVKTIADLARASAFD